jgi:hypothetical protein
VDVLFTHSSLTETRREVKMGENISVLKLIEGVIHMREWVGVLARNLVKSTVINAEAHRAINLTHIKDYW